jgi:hypothetical protein
LNQGDVRLLLFELQRLLRCWRPKLSEEDRVSLDLFHYKNTHDLIYTGINVQMVKAFWAHKKQKANGNTSSHVQLRKYHDAIMWGSQQAKQLLPRAYYDDIEKFLISYRKETVDAKKEGELDEQEADPISWSPFKLILSWALDTSNICVWSYSILQWNCMARSVNIGSLGFHNFRAGEDHIVCCYDDTKSDQTGEKCTDKHIYDNPLEPTVCPFLALAVFFSLKSLHLLETEKLFQADGQTTAASVRDTAVNCRSYSRVTTIICKDTSVLTMPTLMAFAKGVQQK